MLFAADYPFLNVFWTMILFFFWVAWIWVLITIIGDLFSRHDSSGWIKALWTVFLIFLPFLGVLVYMIVNGAGMSERAATAPANGAVRRLRAVGRHGGTGARDREGQVPARQRRDHPGGVRLAEGQGARLS